MRRSLLSIMLMVFVAVSAFCQTDKYRFAQFNISKGLSHNQVNTILRDKRGFMWFGTLSGLNRFDGYKFRVFKHELNDTNSLNDDYVNALLIGPGNKMFVQTRVSWQLYDPLTERFDRRSGRDFKKLGIPDSALRDMKADKQGNFWFLLRSGLYILKKNAYKAEAIKPASHGINRNPITAIAVDHKDRVWLLHNNGQLEQYDQRLQKVTAKRSMGNTGADCRMFCDSDGELWLHNIGLFNGVYRFNPDKGTVQSVNTGTSPLRLNNNIISAVSQDEHGLIWLATDHGGANVIDKKQQTVAYILNNSNDDKSLAQNSVSSLYPDENGGMWLGTFKKGISYYKANALAFPLYKHNPYARNSLQYDDVNRFVEDAAGNIWIGTNGGGLIYFNTKTNTFKQYLHTADANSVSADVIVSLLIDKNQVLWIGTYYGGLDSFDGKTFKHHRHKPNDPYSLTDDRIWEIHEGSDGNLWIGTLSGGLDVFDRKTGKFYHHKKGGKYNIHSTYISALTEDSHGNLWIGTSDGLDVLEKGTKRFINYNHDESNPSSLSNNNVNAIWFDSRKLMWVATREGLDVFGEDRIKKYTLRKEQGLPDNTVLTITEDKTGKIWVSTSNGLSAISLTPDAKKGFTFGFQNYDETDGLQGREFNENAALTTRSGMLMFGGPGGFNWFDPNKISIDNKVPEIVFTDLQLFNKSVAVNEQAGSRVILDRSITETRELVLPYDQNVFSVEFAALNYINSSKSQYAYRMEGFNKEWLIADPNTRTATFTNLNEGTYTLKVRASNESGVWNNKGIELKIKILPPFWRTTWAYVGYVLLAGIILYLIRRRGIQSLKREFAIEQERQEARRMHDLDMMKIKFFTNISHEFRTPLSLILTPVEKLLKHHPVKDDEQRQYQLIYRNARRLLNLVNQLMDFRKMEVKELKLQARQGNIAEFLKDVCYSFTDLADKKNISFSFHSSINELNTRFDHEKLERIMFNLLSNAFKFTPENGSIAVNVVFDSNTSELTISVQDSGIGMTAEVQEKIFDRFYQDDVPGSIMNQGSGIGLSIVREFVRLQGGTIQLDSEPGKGSCFRVMLPLAVETAVVYANEDAVEAIQPVAEDIGMPKQAVTRKHTLLIVEDNEDFRCYIKDNLCKYFNVIEAANGKEGWHKALFAHPDLIVSDISMPEMDGKELCRRIRADNRTQHIPVILLTALTGEEQQLKGLETGASDYMTKPFNFEILISKVWNLIKQQESFRKTYKKQIEIKQEAPVIESHDEKLLKRVLGIIEEHIADPELSVEDLSKRTNMSRVGLYKKMLQLTGKTPVEYIKHIRLERALQLLSKSQMTVSEIAYEVGFSNPKYFTKVFKGEFGILPSAYVKRGNE